MYLLAFEKRWLLRICDAVLPTASHRDLEIGANTLPLAGFLDDLYRSAPTQFLLGVRLATWVVTCLGPALTGRFRTFGALSREERATVLATLAESRLYVLREIPMLLKMIACLGWGGAPAVQTRIGLPVVDSTPPPWMRDQRGQG